MTDFLVLDRLSGQFPELKSQVDEIRNCYTLKLWYQMSDILLGIYNDHKVRKSPILLDLYQEFISDVETKLDQLTLAQMVCKASKFVQGGAKEQNLFVSKIAERLFKDEQAILLCDLTRAQNLMESGVFDETLTILNEATKKMDKIRTNKDPVLYSWYYLTQSIYHSKRGQYDNFYHDALKYLAYTNEKHFEEDEKVDLSLKIADAVLLSEKIYNFSELIDQPILQSLQRSAQHGWVYELIKTFNEGSVDSFNATVKKYESQIKNHKEIAPKVNFLEQKIRITAFLELIFRLPKNDRVVPFPTVAKTAKVQNDEVEGLVMKAMALDLIKGSIDEIDKIVKITWIQPRVVSKANVEVMRKKVDDWTNTLKTLLQSLESQL